MGRADVAVTLLLLLASILTPAAAQGGGDVGFTVEHEGDAARTTDTRHLTHRFYFRVTNTGDEPEYVTVPRSEIRWTGGATGTALGFPSPEFGRAIQPGESGLMWVRLDLPEPRRGAFTASVPFRAESTGVTITREVTITVSEGSPGASAALRVRVLDETDAPVQHAEVQATPLDFAPTGGEADGAHRVEPGGGWQGNLAPGRYAVRADAPGRSGGTEIVDLREGGTEVVELKLAPVAAAVPVREVTVTTVDFGESIWTSAASADLARVATAPMTHSASTPGSFLGVEDGEEAWRVDFPAVEDARQRHASQFQALDTTVAVSPDGALAAGMDWNGRVHVVDWESGEVRWSTDRATDMHPLYPQSSPYRRGFFTSGALAFSPDGARLAAGGSNGWLVAFDTATGDAVWSRGFGGEIRALRFTPDGENLAVGAGDWKFRLLDAATGETRWEGDNEFWPFLHVAVDPDGTAVGAGGKDSVFTAWDADAGAPRWRLDVDPGFVTGATLTRDGGGVVSDWSYGVHGLAADGSHRWFRRLPTATAASTPDGAFTFVSSREPGSGRAEFHLLDANGTTLWQHTPDLNVHCRATVSPFSREHAQTVHLRAEETEGGVTLAAVAGCIGGSVFTFRIPVTAAAALARGEDETQPPEDDDPSSHVTVVPRRDDATTPAETETPGPGGSLAAGVLLAVGRLLRRRRLNP